MRLRAGEEPGGGHPAGKAPLRCRAALNRSALLPRAGARRRGSWERGDDVPAAPSESRGNVDKGKYLRAAGRRRQLKLLRRDHRPFLIKPKLGLCERAGSRYDRKA